MELAHTYSQFYFAAGIHPEHADEVGENDLAEIETLASDEKCAAVGEIGLDYHYPGFDREKQKKLFLRQLELAEKLNLPAVIHSRDATADMVELLAAYKGKAVLHCFSESSEIAKVFLKNGFYLGFGGVVTFQNARRAVESAAICPPEQMLLETDCPYMAPAPFRGKRNDSSFLPLVAEKLAQIKGVTPEEIVKITAQNAKTLFELFKREKNSADADTGSRGRPRVRDHRTDGQPQRHQDRQYQSDQSGRIRQRERIYHSAGQYIRLPRSRRHDAQHRGRDGPSAQKMRGERT